MHTLHDLKKSGEAHTTRLYVEYRARGGGGQGPHVISADVITCGSRSKHWDEWINMASETVLKVHWTAEMDQKLVEMWPEHECLYNVSSDAFCNHSES